MLNCKQATALISQGLDRELSLRERLALRLHLLACDGCRVFRRQARMLREFCRRLTDRPD